MGIYIKGMKMPETCNDCEFLDLDTFDYDMHAACGFTGEIVTYDLRHGRNENCPLIEVTEPHGDLIDRERIDYKNYKMHDGRGNLIVSDTFVDGVTWVDNCIYDTPTVIEAEGE